MPLQRLRPQAVVRWFLARPLYVQLVLILVFVICLMELYSGSNNGNEKVTSVAHSPKFYSDSKELFQSSVKISNIDGKFLTAKQVDLKFPLEIAMRRYKNFEGPCTFNVADYEDPGISRHMVNLGNLDCATPSTKSKVSLNGSSIYVEGRGLSAAQCRSISSGLDAPIVIGSPEVFLSGIHSLKLGESGALRNLASNRCVRPDITESGHVPSQIDLLFDDDCASQVSQFMFEKDGLLRHVLTRKCVMPKDDSFSPPNDTPLVLGDGCKHQFQLYGSKGVLQHVKSKSCIHNLGGGDHPKKGQRICLWNACEDQLRLQYDWYRPLESLPTFSQLSPVPEACYGLMEVELKFVDGTSLFEYVPHVSPLPSVTIAPSPMAPSILLVALEEASAAHIKRKLPNSYAYMREKLKMLEISRFSAVSHSTEENFMAYIRGDSVSNASLSSLFELAQRAGYATMISVDKPTLFANSPKAAMHSSLPLFAHASKYSGLCRSSQTIFDLSFRYMESFVAAYPEHPKLAAMLLSHITSGNFNNLGYMDMAFESLLVDLHRLSSTIIVFTSMRGSLSGKLGQVPQGLTEYTQPYLGIYVSEDIRADRQHLLTEPRFLTTPFNVYGSLAKILDRGFASDARTRSIDELTTERSCVDAGVSNQMCPCV